LAVDDGDFGVGIPDHKVTNVSSSSTLLVSFAAVIALIAFV